MIAVRGVIKRTDRVFLLVFCALSASISWLFLLGGFLCMVQVSVHLYIHGLVIRGDTMRFLQLISVVVILASVVGCSRRIGSSGVSSAAGGPRRVVADTVASPLVAKVERPDLLREVSSLEIAVPVIEADASRGGLSQDQVQAEIRRAAEEIMTLKLSVARASKAGARAGAVSEAAKHGSAVLKTEVARYRERQGSAIGGEPAALSFKMQVVTPASGEVIWSGQYFYQQEPLTENLLKLNDRVGSSGTGAGWISGSALLQRGVRVALQDFNRARENQFVVAGR